MEKVSNKKSSLLISALIGFMVFFISDLMGSYFSRGSIEVDAGTVGSGVGGLVVGALNYFAVRKVVKK
jgi:hypothetical protein